MSREIRSGKLYYYQARRIGGRVVKTYTGTWDEAELYSHLDRERQAKRLLQRLEFAEEQEQFQELESSNREFSRLVDFLVRETLAQAGYHLHHRGEWRKKRGLMTPLTPTEETMTQTEPKTKMESDNQVVRREKTTEISCLPAPLSPEAMLAEITKPGLSDRQREKLARQIVDTPLYQDLPGLIIKTGQAEPKAKEPNPSVVAAAHAMARVLPLETVPSYLNTAGRDNILRTLCDGNTVAEIIEGRHADAMFREIAGDNPTPLESLLTHRIIANWLLVAFAESNLAAAKSMDRILHWEKRVDASTRRHLASVRALAQVRKLQIPTVQIALPGSTQVNVGGQQVNMAHAGAQQMNL